MTSSWRSVDQVSFLSWPKWSRSTPNYDLLDIYQSRTIYYFPTDISIHAHLPSRNRAWTTNTHWLFHLIKPFILPRSHLSFESNEMQFKRLRLSCTFLVTRINSDFKTWISNYIHCLCCIWFNSQIPIFFISDVHMASFDQYNQTYGLYIYML